MRRYIVALFVLLACLGSAIAGDSFNVNQQVGVERAKSASVPPGTLRVCNRISSQTGLRISSTYRARGHNQSVGGSETSMHLAGSRSNPGACDFGGGNYNAGRAACRRAGSTEVMIHSVGTGLHLHCGWVGAKLR